MTHNDDPGPRRLDASGCLESVHTGERYVENNQVRLLGPAQGQRVLAAFGLQQPELRKLRRNERHDRLTDSGMVVHDQECEDRVRATHGCKTSGSESTTRL